MGLAESRIEEGRWQDAQETVSVLLQPQYNPNYKPAQRLLARLESPDYFNKTVTPGFVARVEEVKTLLNEGQGLYDSGRFDEATAKYEAVLRVDRYNVAARRGMEQVNVAKMRVADAACDLRGVGNYTCDPRRPTLLVSSGVVAESPWLWHCCHAGGRCHLRPQRGGQRHLRPADTLSIGGAAHCLLESGRQEPLALVMLLCGWPVPLVTPEGWATTLATRQSARRNQY